jgi:hypothetical protein
MAFLAMMLNVALLHADSEGAKDDANLCTQGTKVQEEDIDVFILQDGNHDGRYVIASNKFDQWHTPSMWILTRKRGRLLTVWAFDFTK